MVARNEALLVLQWDAEASPCVKDGGDVEGQAKTRDKHQTGVLLRRRRRGELCKQTARVVAPWCQR